MATGVKKGSQFWTFRRGTSIARRRDMNISTRLLGFVVPVLFLAACSADVESTNIGNVVPAYRIEVVTISPAPNPPPSTPAELAGQCLDQSPARTLQGDPDCVVLIPSIAGNACVCDPNKAQRAVVPAEADARAALAADPRANEFGWDCYCAVEPLAGQEADACRTDPSLQTQSPYHGYCAVDIGTSPAVGDAAVLASCPSGSMGIVRLLGDAQIEQDPAVERYMAVVCKSPTP
jgi:hypothetical protein